jgi:hypothetical protein
LQSALSLCIIDETAPEEVAAMSEKTAGIVVLVLGILALIWPSMIEAILGVFLILLAVLMLMGRTRIMK